MKYFLTLLGIFFAMPWVRAQSLDAYIEEAMANNPNIQAFELQYDISREKVNEAGWLPNTELGVGVFVSEPETRTGAQVVRFSGRQMIPWFGTIGAREDLANSNSATEYLDWVIAKRRLALNVSQSYYRLYELNADLAILDENIALLTTYEELALKAVEVDRASAVDVLRLQIRQNELERQKQVLQETIRGEQAQFNSLLNREPGAAISVVEILALPEEDWVQADSLLVNPELLRFDALYESVVNAEGLNQKEQKPMLGFGLDYIPVQERPDVVISDNGKDIFMPMVSLSVPLFNSSYKSRSRQNELRQQEIIFQRKERLNTLEAALTEAVSERNEARINYKTQVENIARARDAESILIKSYETGKMDFTDILEIQEMQLKFQMAQIEAIRSYYTQAVWINYLTR